MEEAFSKTEFRNAMARVCAPVNVITTNGPAGRGGVHRHGHVQRHG
ncbi:flavin reductase (DIM6/NTAB) family NADH-FMN oxidoreductase RutF [Rhizobium ruizarguesonis]